MNTKNAKTIPDLRPLEPSAAWYTPGNGDMHEKEQMSYRQRVCRHRSHLCAINLLALPAPLSSAVLLSQQGLNPYDLIDEGGGHGGSLGSSKLGTAHVRVGQLHTADILLLLDQQVSVIDERLQSHVGLLKLHLAFAAVDQALANVLQACALHELADLYT